MTTEERWLQRHEHTSAAYFQQACDIGFKYLMKTGWNTTQNLSQTGSDRKLGAQRHGSHTRRLWCAKNVAETEEAHLIVSPLFISSSTIARVCSDANCKQGYIEARALQSEMEGATT